MGIESINNEGRVFNPSDETVNTANISGMDNYKVILAGGYSSTEETGDGWDVNLQYGALWMDYSEDATGTPRIVVDFIHALSKKVALIAEVMVQDGTDQRGVALLSMDF